MNKKDLKLDVAYAISNTPRRRYGRGGTYEGTIETFAGEVVTEYPCRRLNVKGRPLREGEELRNRDGYVYFTERKVKRGIVVKLAKPIERTIYSLYETSHYGYPQPADEATKKVVKVDRVVVESGANFVTTWKTWVAERGAEEEAKKERRRQELAAQQKALADEPGHKAMLDALTARLRREFKLKPFENWRYGADLPGGYEARGMADSFLKIELVYNEAPCTTPEPAWALAGGSASMSLEVLCQLLRVTWETGEDGVRDADAVLDEIGKLADANVIEVTT